MSQANTQLHVPAEPLDTVAWGRVLQGELDRLFDADPNMYAR